LRFWVLGFWSVDRVDAVAELSIPPLVGRDPEFKVLGFWSVDRVERRGRAVHAAARG